MVTLLGLLLCEVCVYSGKPGAYPPFLEAGIWAGLVVFIFGMVVLVAGGLRRAKILRLGAGDGRAKVPKWFRWAMLGGILLLNAGIWIQAFFPGRPIVSPILVLVGMAVMLVTLERLA